MFDFLTPFLLFYYFIGPDKSETQLPGPDSKVLGTAGMYTENSSRRAQNPGLVCSLQGSTEVMLSPVVIHIV